MYRHLIVILGICFSNLALAEDINISFTRAGVANATYGLIIPTDPIYTPKPPCATTDILSWDKTTDHGKMMMDIALTALSQGKTIIVGYNNTVCSEGNRLKMQKIQVFQ